MAIEINEKKKKWLRLLLSGLAAGDSLGSTSEFIPQSRIPALYERYSSQGWPFRQVGGRLWSPGEPTDDTEMAMCIVSSVIENKDFIPSDIAQRFVKWMKGGPKDIGLTTYHTLLNLESGAPWYEGGLSLYEYNKKAWSNGSLMRNGVIPALAESLDEAYHMTLAHNLMTHYAPLPVLCSVIHTYLLWQSLQGDNPLAGDWLNEALNLFDKWLESDNTSAYEKWKQTVGNDYNESKHFLVKHLSSVAEFDPFTTNYSGRDGYCLLTLQIAIWGLSKSLNKKAPPVPTGFPAEVFERTGPYALSWIAMIGHDSDTYGAVAGPLIAAVHKGLPAEMIQGLYAIEQLEGLIR